MSDPTVTVSWGELFDRISILEIKHARLTSPQAQDIVIAQLTALRSAENTLAPKPPKLAELRKRLKSVNERLWTTEDDLRSHEARKDFDVHFVELARSVYLNNDERTRLKRAIDRLLGSDGEPKAYVQYTEDKDENDPEGSP